MTVTETTDKELTLRVASPNGKSGYLIIFDNDWNAKQQAQTKYTPSDGRGAPQEAKIGTAWNTNFTWQNLDKGGGGKGQANGKCLGNEHVTTQAGTFDTLKCVVTI